LCNATRRSAKNRQILYRNLCTGKRVEVLGGIAKMALAPRVVKLVSLTDWRNFARKDWSIFLALAAAEGGDSALGHLPSITPTLVRQFSRIPFELRLPAILRVACALEVPVERWERLHQFLAGADAGRRADLLRIAGTVDSNGAFWDFYFRCEGKYWQAFDIPKSLFSSTILKPIGTPLEMEEEAFRMKNCLANRVSRVRSGGRIYFRRSNGTPVDAELVRKAAAWVPGAVLGPNNAAVPAAIAKTVRQQLQRLAATTTISDDSGQQIDEDAYIQRLRDDVRQSFNERNLAVLTAPLRSIQAKSRSWRKVAFAIFEVDGAGYVQFMSSPDGTEYLCEICSHKYAKSVNNFLTATAVDLIERAGFVWPNAKANFDRWFNIFSEKDIQAMAEVALAILSGIFGYRKGHRLAVRTHIPD
jgi:hypothetical protein